jgi:hypothetical protein
MLLKRGAAALSRKGLSLSLTPKKESTGKALGVDNLCLPQQLIFWIWRPA